MGDLPLSDLAHLARKEGQRTRDIYRVHRWFARRLSTQFRSILAALTLEPEQAQLFWERYHSHIPLDDLIVLDPFVGGGTSVVEASRCGARVLGFDIDPIATSITRFELEATTYRGLAERAEAYVADLAERMRPCHQTTLPDGTAAEVLHHFWVEVTTCDRCLTTFELHPHYQLAYDRTPQKQWVFCRECHHIQELPLERQDVCCACGDGHRMSIQEGTIQQGIVRCPHCGYKRKLSEGKKKGPPRWRLFAQEYVSPNCHAPHRVFKRATDADQHLYNHAACALRHLVQEQGPIAPERPIPSEGRHDRRPLIHGMRTYADLFNDRQLLHLTLLGHRIRATPDKHLKQLLVLAFSEHLTANCMYTGYAYGYRRTCALFSLHGYRHVVRPVEINPWLTGIGRGTFPNVVRKIARAIVYAQAPTDLKHARETTPIGPVDGVVSPDPLRVIHGQCYAAIKTQSSTDLSTLPDGVVHLILTDPPYFDNISYSELSDFYLAWQQQLQTLEPPYDDPRVAAPIRDNLAVTPHAPRALERYGYELTTILRECARVLHPEGVCVFTYHHISEDAWLLLGQALAASGLRCTGVLPMRGEGQGGLHTKAGTIKWDAVLVCRKADRAQPHHSELSVTPAILAEARATVQRYVQRFEKEGSVDFRPPDQRNLFHALLVTQAFVCRGPLPSIPLRTALSLSFQL